jgi:PAS domain-containing protein
VRDFETALQEAIKTRGTFHKICRIRRTGGDQRWLQIDGRSEKTTTVKPARLAGVIADITARKRLEGRAQVVGLNAS